MLKAIRAWLFVTSLEDEFDLWDKLSQEQRIELELFRVRNDNCNLGF